MMMKLKKMIKKIHPSEEDEFNVSLAKMEEEIKPKIIHILELIK